MELNFDNDNEDFDDDDDDDFDDEVAEKRGALARYSAS